MREVGGAQPPRLVPLAEEHFLRRTVRRPPHLDPPLQRTQLALGEAPRLLPLQRLKQRLGFQPGAGFDPLPDLLPDFGERVRARSPDPLSSQFARQLPRGLVLPGGLDVHPRFRSRNLLIPLCFRQSKQPPHLVVCDHSGSLSIGKPPWSQPSSREGILIVASREF